MPADLILWRHAHAGTAGQGAADLDRPLSSRGERDALRMARWLARHLPKSTLVLCSPARRTQQTAQALGWPLRTLDALRPESDVDAAWAALSTSVLADGLNAPVLVVGHQPLLGQLAARCLTGRAQDWSVNKGAIWWLRQRRTDGRDGVTLRTVLGPGDL